MGWLSQRASKRALSCLAVFSVGGIAGLLAGVGADAVQTSELSPAQIVALRFPGDSTRLASNPISRSPAPAGIDPAPAARYVLASAGAEAQSSLMFSPFPTYSMAPHPSAADPAPAPSSPTNSPPPRSSTSRPVLPPQLVTASAQIPAAALAYAAPDEDAPVMPARPDNAGAGPTSAKRAIQTPRPAGPASPSNAVLNNAQIASIRERLKLTSYQDQMWPPVESALRDISWHPGHADMGGRKVASSTASTAHGATIDPNSPPVQRLKSAAFPLIMSLSDDQKEEVRTMVRLMGLENLASQF